MSNFQRAQVRELVYQLTERRSMRIAALTGPRQTGKTTIVLQACQQLDSMGLAHQYVALDESTAWIASSPWARSVLATSSISSSRSGHVLVKLWTAARQEAIRHKGGFVLVLDEVQAVPKWSGIVKGLWDADRREACPLQVVVLGSAPWRMLTGLNESLAGRFETIRVAHWSLPEVTHAFDMSLEEFVFFGGYPGTLTDRPGMPRESAWRDQVMRSIVAPAIERDIVALTRVRKPALLRQLMDLAPHYSGQFLSYNKMLGQLHDVGNTTTVARYLDLLSDAGLVTGLTRFSPAPHLGRASPRKLNVLNTALITAPSGYSFEQAKNDRSYWGRLVESAVGAHLLNTRSLATRVHYWRDPPYEVDFVLVRGPHVLGIEVKSGASRRLAGLQAFASRYRSAKTLIVGTGGIPLHEFLSKGADDWLDRQ